MTEVEQNERIQITYPTVLFRDSARRYRGGSIYDVWRIPYASAGSVILSVVQLHGNGAIFGEIDDTRGGDPVLIRMEEFQELERAMLRGAGIRGSVVREIQILTRNREWSKEEESPTHEDHECDGTSGDEQI